MHGEMRASLQAINETLNRLLALRAEAGERTQAVARLKTIRSLAAAGIAFLAATLKD